ncbi:unnamed protein product [Cladocopium goreaui]|uniref:S-formylglutathione hydrolase n=1 Tax=Cladocopium goreaui TaxID=2562237 RepID=A0A9P1GQD1_9DINO|nr:unnamed protein product [Cladocopium goreaui]
MARWRSLSPFRTVWASSAVPETNLGLFSQRIQCRRLRHLMAPPELLEIAEHRCFKGTLYRFEHISPVLGDCTMKLSTFVPSGKGKFPGVIWLSGLTGTDESLAQRASSALEVAQELQLILIMPDTSPRGEGVPDEDPKAFDFGVGASFYVNATTQKYKKHYQMLDYITQELPSMVAAKLPLLQHRLGIMGHSMGGHGALVAALRYPELYRSVSAFSPIVHPTESPWGQKAFSLYLGEDPESWRQYDTLELLKQYKGPPKRLLVDQGLADPFLSEQLKPGLLKALCDEKGLALTLRNQQDYDHSYYFISSFIQDHLQYHASFLTGVLRWCPDADHPLAPSVYSVDPQIELDGDANVTEATEMPGKEESQPFDSDDHPDQRPQGDAMDAVSSSEETHPTQSSQLVLNSSSKEIECLAAVCFEEAALELMKIQVAPPGPGELRIRITAVAPSPLDVAGQKERSGGPRILGVEAAGVVEDVGEGVEDFRPGDHVIPCCHASCGRCSACRRGDTNFCESIQRFTSRGVMKDDAMNSTSSTRFSYGSTEIFHFHGVSTFSEYTVVHAESVAKIRKDAPLEKVCLLGGGVAAALGMVWQVAGPSPGAVGAIFGLNAEGLAVARALHMAKARKIIAVDPDPSRLELAKKWGATNLINPYALPEGCSIKEEILRAADAPADVAFDLLGYEASVQEAITTPWAKSFAMEITCSPFNVTPRLAGMRNVPFGGWRPKLHLPLLVVWIPAGVAN